MRTRTIACDARPLCLLWLIALCAAAALALSACDMGGAIGGYMGDEGDGGGGGPSSVLTASYTATGTIGVLTRSILVSFSRPLDAEEQQYIEDNLSVVDDEGDALVGINAYWLSDSLLRICGLLEYGAAYHVDIGDLAALASVNKAVDVGEKVTLDVNPFDFDAGLANSADIAYIHTDRLGRPHWVILDGEQISLSYSIDVPTDTLVNNDLVWSYPMPGKGSTPQFMRNWDGSGRPSVNAAYLSDPIKDQNTHLVWNAYDMFDTDYQSSILPPAWMPAVCRNRLLTGIGDLNGDGIDDAMYGLDCSTTGTDLISGIGIILGPIPSNIDMVPDSLWKDIGYIGSATPTSPLYAAYPMRTSADLDGDGFFDIVGFWRDAHKDASDHTVIDSSEVQIFFGSAEVSSMLSAPGATISMTQGQRDFTGAYASDVNGDGKSDLILASVQRPLSGVLDSVNPQVHVFLGGESMRSAMTDADASFVIRQTQMGVDATVSVSVIGDENADGREDIFLNYAYTLGGVRAKVMFLMYGRAENKDEYVIEADYDKYIVPGSNYGQDGLGFPQRAGDINNDGYDDIMLVAEANDLGQNVYLVIMGGSTGEIIMLASDVHTRVKTTP